MARFMGPEPSSSTSPAKSEPNVSGRGCGKALRPERIQESQGPTPAACTFKSTSPEPGLGRGTVSKVIFSGEPKACTRQAFISTGDIRRAALLSTISGSNPCKLVIFQSDAAHRLIAVKGI